MKDLERCSQYFLSLIQRLQHGAAVTVGSPMAQLAAKAMAEAYPEADFAFAMAKNVASSLYPGNILLEDINIVSQGEQDRELVLVQATGEQI